MKVRIVLPIQFRDIDRMGHVNHAVYLQYMETARIELARQLGLIRHVSSSSFIVAMARVEYKRPIREEPRVAVTCWVSRLGERSWDLDYTVGYERVLFAIGRTTQVNYDYDTESTFRTSEKLRNALRKYAGKPLRFREVEEKLRKRSAGS